MKDARNTGGKPVLNGRAKTLQFLEKQVENARDLDAACGKVDEIVVPRVTDAFEAYENVRRRQEDEEHALAEEIRCLKLSPEGGILSEIVSPADLKGLSLEQLECLARELRQTIIQTVAKNGGHLAPSLGVVELTLAMLSVYSPPEDKIVWDVGHQAYAYKLLTGRGDRFHTLRKLGGISGFPRMSESEYDAFGVGHSSTSISAALGMAVARDLEGRKDHVLAVIGDGALTSGIAYEALNHAGGMGRPFTVILNDNDMSIAKNVGALSIFMSRNLSTRWVRQIRREVEGYLRSIPEVGEEILRRVKSGKCSLKNFFTPGMLFEALGFNYVGPVNGHDISELKRILGLASSLEKPVLIHVLTHKGRGYEPAEQNPARFHGVGKFDPETGCLAGACTDIPTYTEVFGSTLCSLAEKDKRVVAITAAMPEGTGLQPFSEQFPDRFFDVGICEQHSVTFAAGLATQGFRPVVALYSTFLQRAYDQVIHDVCIQNLPVLFCLDRGGLVGEDGATHQGAFDLAYLRPMPNMVLFAPKDEGELQQGLVTGLAHDGPFAMRYPRGIGLGIPLRDKPLPLPVGEGEFMKRGDSGLAVIAIGNRVHPAHLAALTVEKETGRKVTVYNARWVKPLPEKDIKEIAHSHDKLIIVEEGVLAGGFSSAVLECLADSGLAKNLTVKRMGIPDEFVEHGAADALRKRLGFDVDGIAGVIREMLQ